MSTRGGSRLRTQRDIDAENAYGTAFEEWEASGDQAQWDQAIADGLAK